MPNAHAIDGVDVATKKKIIRLVNALFPDAAIYLYGSRARGTFRQWSDIDLAIDTGNKLERLDVAEARDLLNELNAPYRIDIVDLHGISETMKESILREKKIWK